MKFLIAKYNAHPGMKKPIDNLQVEFPISHGDEVAHTLGFSCWQKVRFELICEGTNGYTMRLAHGKLPTTMKLAERGRYPTVKDPSPELRLGFTRTERQLSRLTLMPEFRRDWVDVIRDDANHTIFIPNVAEWLRMPVKKRNGGRARKVELVGVDAMVFARAEKTPSVEELREAPVQPNTRLFDPPDVAEPDPIYIDELKSSWAKFNEAIGVCTRAGVVVVVSQEADGGEVHVEAKLRL